MLTKIIVVIPIYKSFQQLTCNEKRSFVQACTVLKSYAIYLVGPESLNFSDYTSMGRDMGVEISTEIFDGHYFESIKGYNDLLLSEIFYERFSNFMYMLLYQLDAWIFSNDLKYWVNLNLDYVGSPLFEDFDLNTNFKFMQGLNGGFSLRNIPKSAKMIAKVAKLQRLYKFCRNLSQGRGLRFIDFFLKSSYLLGGGKIYDHRWFVHIIRDELPNEDYVWSYIFPSVFGGFTVSDSQTAIRFSFEMHPSYLYELNRRQLPMGCHAWEKYELEFWKSFIPAQ